MSTIHQARDAYILGPHDGGAIWLMGDLHVWKATGVATQGAYALMETVVVPGGEPPPHLHHNEDEAFYLLEGAMTFIVGDRTLPAQVGSFVFAPKDLPHSFTVTDPARARFLTIVSPAGFEGFSEEMGRPAEALTTPPAAPPDFEKLAMLTKKYGLEIVGPSPDH